MKDLEVKIWEGEKAYKFPGSEIFRTNNQKANDYYRAELSSAFRLDWIACKEGPDKSDREDSWAIEWQLKPGKDHRDTSEVEIDRPNRFEEVWCHDGG